LPTNGISDGAESFDYCCPYCGTEPSVEPEGYDIDGVHYPIITNEHKAYSAWHDNMVVWEETHKCAVCGHTFWFENSNC
jgi:hypothetical protein